MNNPFNLKIEDIVVVIHGTINFGKIGKIMSLDDDGYVKVYFGGTNSIIRIENLEPLVRNKKPEPVFVPKFKKGDIIISNSHCEYNKGKYTVSSKSWINSSNCKEYCSVDEIHPVLNVDWYDKYVPVKRFAIGDNVRYSHKTFGVDIIFDVKVLGYDDICNNKFYGEVIRQGSGPYSVGLKATFFDDYFTLIPFEPTIRKGEEFIYNEVVRTALDDSYILNGIEEIKLNCFTIASVKDCRKFKYLD